MTVHIVPKEVAARRAELETLLADTTLTDALNRLKATDLPQSLGQTRDNLLILVTGIESIATNLDTLITHSIGLLNDTDTNFVQTDQQLAQALGGS